MVLAPEDKPKTPDDFDRLVCAELSDQNLQPTLFASISKHTVHGPCGELNSNSPCMENGKCSKRYKKDFAETTITNEHGYPLYRRRNNGRTINKHGKIIDNRWIVPYNPYLSQKYDCHINVEICSSIRSIKYLHKYVYKGPDRAILTVREPDEITEYLNARYVSAAEACWRLFNFGMQERSHTVERLPVHLPRQYYVTFAGGQDLTSVLEEQTNTKLTRYFETCANNSNIHLRYIDFSQYFV